jgi:hypothetical protein
MVNRWFYEHENPFKKFDCGAQMVEGGGGKVGSRRGRSEGDALEGENKRGGGASTYTVSREQCKVKLRLAIEFYLI